LKSEGCITLTKEQIPATTDYRGVRNAWLSPNGTFYEVEKYSHNESGEALGVKWSIWARLSCGYWNRMEVTQPQLDVIFDWCLANGEEMPEVRVK
jgi:hypothetical protein